MVAVWNRFPLVNMKWTDHKRRHGFGKENRHGDHK